MSLSTETPSYAVNTAVTTTGVTFDIPSGKQTVHVKISNDSIRYLPTRRGATSFTGSGLTHSDLTMNAMNNARHPVEVLINNTNVLLGLMKFEDKLLVSFPTLIYRMKIYTTYKISRHESVTIDSLQSTYGRGTTSADRAADHISIRFHESQHGAYALSYLKDHPVPVLTLKAGLKKEDVNTILLKLFTDYSAYQRALSNFMEYDVDCVGDMASYCSSLQR